MTEVKKAQEACFYHMDAKAYNYCDLCELPICPACINEIIINNESKIVCKECLNTLKKSKVWKKSNQRDIAPSIYHEESVGFRINYGTLVGLIIEMLILGLIAKAIIDIALKKQIEGIFDVWDIVSVVILAFIFWSILIYMLKKLRRKVPTIIKKS